ncbi:MAG TPA: transketolase C-terminal domain-containing protein, partial [Armatimonadaceae bacterium]|nr:transketolase C-terminal domain-containing protein [Armatimonadaceae bacterium]
MAKLRYVDALTLALQEEMDRDESVFIIGEEVGQYLGTLQVTKGFLDKYGPKRVVDTPISEVGIVGIGIGSAMAGLRPVCEMMRMDFALPAYDQIAQHAAKIRYMFGGQFKVPMVIRGPSGVVNQLSAQHSQSLEVLFCHCPGLKVVAPATPADAKGLLKAAIRDDNPVVVLEALKVYFDKPERLDAILDGLSDVPDDPEYVANLGEAKVLREGKDVTLIGYSTMTITCLRAANKLAEEGISAEVVDLRSLLPLDMAT